MATYWTRFVASGDPNEIFERLAHSRDQRQAHPYGKQIALETIKYRFLSHSATNCEELTHFRGCVMGFLTQRRPSYPVRVLIMQSAAHDPEVASAGLKAGESYTVTPHLAEYLIGSNRAIIDRRRFPRERSERIA